MCFEIEVSDTLALFGSSSSFSTDASGAYFRRRSALGRYAGGRAGRAMMSKLVQELAASAFAIIKMQGKMHPDKHQDAELLVRQSSLG